MNKIYIERVLLLPLSGPTELELNWSGLIEFLYTSSIDRKKYFRKIEKENRMSFTASIESGFLDPD